MTPSCQVKAKDSEGLALDETSGVVQNRTELTAAQTSFKTRVAFAQRQKTNPFARIRGYFCPVNATSQV